MDLKLVLQETGQSWTLEPTRDYFVGSDRTCDINLSQYPDVASRHLRLSCDRVSNIWYVEDLGTTVGTYIDGKAISRSLIEEVISIKLANHVLITAQPVSELQPISGATVVSTAPSGRLSSSYNTEEVRNPGFREVVKEGGRSGFSSGDRAIVLPEASVDRPIDREIIREYFECLRKRRLAKKIEEPMINQVWSTFLKWIDNKSLTELGTPIWVASVILLLCLISQTAATLSIIFLIFVLLCILKTSRDPVLPELPVSDKQIDIWLQQDFAAFGENARKRLNILRVDEGGSETQNTMVSEHPIMMLSPIKWTDENRKTGLVLNLERNEAENGNNWFSNLDDFFFEKGSDDVRRGSLNDFIVIFLCKNFISYYRGTWHSIEGVLLDGNTDEFMYDSIASVRTLESSDIMVIKDNGRRVGTRKHIWGEVLAFSTDDGERTSFAMNDDVKKYTPSSNVVISTARESADLMRREIRQRRIDVQIVKNQTI